MVWLKYMKWNILLFMKRFLLYLLILVNFVGCTLVGSAFRVPSPQFPGRVSDVKFERTPDRVVESIEKDTRRVTARFASCNFRDGMRQLTELTGCPISWEKTLDNETVDGVFVDKPLNEVLDLLSRRLNVSVTESQGMYFLGTVRPGDMVSAVVRIPPVDREELKITLSSLGSGKTTIIGSFIWINDTLENVRKLVSDLDVLREKSERSYLAEVFFIRVNEDDFLRLTADLRISQVDIFSSAFNISQLFGMFVDVDGKLGVPVHGIFSFYSEIGLSSSGGKE
jgi:hypothetical protein